MRNIKKWTSMFVLMTTIWSCDNNDEIKAEDRLIGNWEHTLTVRGSEQLLSGLGPEKYNFKADKTFVKYLGSLDWRDEGTWIYEEDTRTLSLNYKTYTNQISDTQLLDLKIEKITDKEFVIKIDFNGTNDLGEFIEFEFIHYLKK